jgi:hypothetical protein
MHYSSEPANPHLFNWRFFFFFSMHKFLFNLNFSMSLVQCMMYSFLYLINIFIHFFVTY